MTLTLSQVLTPLLGGLLIGLASIGLMLFNGRIAGISGIFAGTFSGSRDERGWRVSFVAGLLLGGAALLLASPGVFTATPAGLPLTIVAGLLVGFGTRLGSGCTSGHGVCGMSRFSPRSFVATLTFIATGMVAVGVARAAMGG